MHIEYRYEQLLESTMLVLIQFSCIEDAEMEVQLVTIGADGTKMIKLDKNRNLLLILFYF